MARYKTSTSSSWTRPLLAFRSSRLGVAHLIKPSPSISEALKAFFSTRSSFSESSETIIWSGLRTKDFEPGDSRIYRSFRLLEPIKTRIGQQEKQRDMGEYVYLHRDWD
jgi:hypothetical protein